jgi:hypothetical protein
MMGKLVVMATVCAGVAQAQQTQQQLQGRNADLVPTRVEIVPARATPSRVAVLRDALRRDSLGLDSIGRGPLRGDSVAPDVVPGDSVLRLSVHVRNSGRLEVLAPTPNRIGFTVDGTEYETELVPTSGTHTFPIPPRGLARMSVEIPLGTLRHCQYVAVRIDTKQQFQRGSARIGANDSARLPVRQRSATAQCTAEGPTPRP